MITWDAEAVVIWHGDCHKRGRELRLEVEPATLFGSSVWYWRVRDEELRAVCSGTRNTVRQAKASCTRAANKYARRAP